MTTKIAILGTCVSEDWIHFQPPRSRLDVKLEPRYQPSSLISIVADPVVLDLQPGPRMTPQLETSLRSDLDKSFLPTLAETQPDFLIVELMFDSRKDRGGGGHCDRRQLDHKQLHTSPLSHASRSQGRQASQRSR